MAFSATDAAFEGFRLVRRNPLALVAWTLLYAVLTLTALFSLSTMIGPLEAWTAQAEAMESVDKPSLDQIMGLMSQFGVIMAQVAWLLPVSLIVGAMLSAAVARGVLSPSRDRFGYLRLGMDEVRVLVVTFVLGLVMGLGAFVAFLAWGLLIAAAKTGGGDGVAAIAAIVGFLAIVCGFVWLAVRLSLAAPITVAEKRFAFFDSFAVTKGRFWPLLGMAVLAVVMVLLIQLLSSIVTMPLAIISGLESWSFGSGQDPEAVRAALDVTNPWVIGQAVVEAIVSALTVGIMYAPFAAAYRDITGRATPAA
ncbi:hypothetical protein [Brevundimonas sp. Root1423]|uniref:hypothetical protein n=1 Tax=Brevundimonas sp. Root1423 TaxID=1736462 RepID=UPI0006F5D192|nr:hypothetical protein [Brevundimonas sp. Root1423]KQY75092.1 hypothetical protein ASD25_10900 [Brevundimonas sp. Root1423]